MLSVCVTVVLSVSCKIFDDITLNVLCGQKDLCFSGQRYWTHLQTMNHWPTSPEASWEGKPLDSCKLGWIVMISASLLSDCLVLWHCCRGCRAVEVSALSLKARHISHKISIRPACGSMLMVAPSHASLLTSSQSDHHVVARWLVVLSFKSGLFPHKLSVRSPCGSMLTGHIELLSPTSFLSTSQSDHHVVICWLVALSSKFCHFPHKLSIRPSFGTVLIGCTEL